VPKCRGVLHHLHADAVLKKCAYLYGHFLFDRLQNDLADVGLAGILVSGRVYVELAYTQNLIKEAADDIYILHLAIGYRNFFTMQDTSLEPEVIVLKRECVEMIDEPGNEDAPDKSEECQPEQYENAVSEVLFNDERVEKTVRIHNGIQIDYGVDEVSVEQSQKSGHYDHADGRRYVSERHEDKCLEAEMLWMSQGNHGDNIPCYTISMSTAYVNDAVFWIEIEKITPNPYQPRHEFDQAKLKDLSESIRMYGVMQPLIVTRKEVFREEGGMVVEYELISGERRLRASKLAGLTQVPALIRNSEDDGRVKLELAIIENLQREDLNAVDRARSFERLAKEFGLKQHQIAEKVGKSREYVSNSLRILSLPEEMLGALADGKISEGHTRPLLMLGDRPEEQLVLFKEIMTKKLTVREAESLSRRVATDRIRNKGKYLDPHIIEMEKSFTESLGTRVRIEKGKEGGTVTIDFFSPDDLRALLEKFSAQQSVRTASTSTAAITDLVAAEPTTSDQEGAVDDRTQEEKDKGDTDLYSLKNFAI
jgi:ParB family transcriptional regulator, chromosome partitioning protein